MRGHSSRALGGVSVQEAIAANARLRAAVDAAVPVGLHVCVIRGADRVAAPGHSQLALELPAGSLLVGLALLHDSVLLPTPGDRVLNRNVRGILRGLGAQYFGGEHLVIGGRPVAWVGYDRDPDGRVLVQAFVGVERSIRTDPASDMRGRAWASLRDFGIDDSLAELADRIVAGHVRFGVEFEP